MLAHRSYRSVQAQALHYLARPHRGVPARAIEGPAAWRPADFSNDSQWSYTLSPGEIAGLESALRATRGSPLSSLRARDFALGSLVQRLPAWKECLSAGRGFLRVRGLPVERWEPDEVERFFWALGQHLGHPGAQNGQGELLGHVRDLQLGRPGELRQYMTSERISFHCDAADVVGLLCLRPSASGGQSRIASSVSIYNRILELHPEWAGLLFEPMYFDSRGDGGTDAFRARPCAYYQGRLRTFYHAEYIRTASRHPGIPALRDEQRAILDLYDELAESPDFHLSMDLEAGDVQLLSNHSLVHARGAYSDPEDPGQRRHLLRLWLSLESMSSLDEALRRSRSLLELIAGLVRRRLS